MLAALATKDPDEAKRIAVRFHSESGDLDAALLASAIDAQRGDLAGGYARIKGELAKSPAALQAWLARSMTLAPKEARQLLELASEHEALYPEAFASMWSALATRGGLNAADRAKSVVQRMPQNPERSLLRAAVRAEVELARADAPAFAEARANLAALVPESFRGVLEGRSAPAPDGSEAARYVAEIAASEALVLVERRRELDRALALIDASLSLVDSPAYRVTRGRALLARGDTGAARQVAERLNAEAPLNVDAWVLLANAALRAGDQIVARKAVERGRDAAARAFFVAPSVLQELELIERSAQDTLEPLG